MTTTRYQSTERWPFGFKAQMQSADWSAFENWYAARNRLGEGASPSTPSSAASGVVALPPAQQFKAAA